MMRAFHVNSTAPSQTYYGRSGHTAYHLEDFEILVTVLSALEWRRHNGPIKLYTDRVGADHYDQIGLADLWDAGIDTEVLENCQLKTNSSVFWAFARTVALGHERCPCVLLDMDMIVWRNIAPLLRAEFMAIHSEPLAFEVYVPKEELHTPPGYVWDEWDWTVSPLNAALMYFGCDDLREYCVTKGLEFMHNNFPEPEQGWPMHAVFVEQRLYPMCARKLGIDMAFFLLDWRGDKLVSGEANDAFTHLWVYKYKLIQNIEERKRICVKMVKRILLDFPEFDTVLEAIPNLRPYLEPARLSVTG